MTAAGPAPRGRHHDEDKVEAVTGTLIEAAAAARVQVAWVAGG